MKKILITLCLVIILVAGLFIGFVVSSSNLNAGARFGTDHTITYQGVTYFDCSDEPSNCCVVWP